MHDLIVLGGGPTGLAATMYGIKKRLDVLLIAPNLLGKARYRAQFPFAERYQAITGWDTADRFASEVGYLDFARADDETERVEAIDGGYAVYTHSGQRHDATAIIVATGASGRRLNVPGEHEFSGRALAYSTILYAHLCLDRQVTVIGGGARALRGAAELIKVVRHVHLVAPGEIDRSLPLADRLLQAKNATILEGYDVVEVFGDRFARGVVLSRDEERKKLEADATFVELQLVPDSELVAHLVDRDENGHIKVDCANRTSRPGIFAAGAVTDVVTELVMIAIGEGAQAALSAHTYLLSQPD